MGARFLVGDVHDRLPEIPDNSVDLLMSSPPFLALRSYLPADHPDKGKEIGSESDPGMFVDVLCGLVDELVRVLAPHGSMVFELGDTYSGSGGGGGDYLENGLREGQPGFGGSARSQRDGNAEHWRAKNQPGAVWPRPKSLALVPELFRITLAYGTNPLTGRVWWEGGDRWMVRNVIRWVRPNPPVGALGDKFRPATSELVVFTRDPKRYFDLDAVRTPSDYDRPNLLGQGSRSTSVPGQRKNASDHTTNPGGAPPLDWWKISPKGFKGSHYATWPAELCVIPIKSMCPERVCRTCGEPSRRITGDAEYVPSASYRGGHMDLSEDARVAPGVNQFKSDGGKASVVRSAPTLGWSDCGHDNWRPGMVCDPFGGTGVTAAVATGHGRDCILIDIDPRNADLALDRVGPLMLDVDYGTRV